MEIKRLISVTEKIDRMRSSVPACLHVVLSVRQMVPRLAL